MTHNSTIPAEIKTHLRTRFINAMANNHKDSYKRVKRFQFDLGYWLLIRLEILIKF